MRRALCIIGLLFVGCGHAAPQPPPPVSTAGPPLTPDPPKVEFGSFHGGGWGAWMAPDAPLVDGSGGFDLLVEFNAGMMLERDVRELGAPFVWACMGTTGMGTPPFWDAFENPARFGEVVADVERGIQKATGRKDAHVRRLGIVGWSAGYASVQQILRVPKYFDAIGAVILLDGLHTGYVHGMDGKPTKEPELRTIGPIVRYAEEATKGNKVFVFTHTAIVPPDYASTTEVAEALIRHFNAPRDGDSASLGNFHVLARGGQGQKDHVDNLHLLVPVLKRWVLDRWR